MSGRISVGMAGLNDMPHVLYRWFDASDVLLYVGITMDLPKRSKQHRSGKPWWTAAAYTTYEHFATRAEAKAAETRAIKDEKPLYNDAENVYVEVETPQTYDVAADVLTQLTESRDGFENAVAEAREAIAEHEEDKDQDPVCYAAVLAAVTTIGDLYQVSRALRDLIQTFPADQRQRCELLADAQVEAWGYEDGKYDRLTETARAITIEVADVYLDTLPEKVREAWLTAARAVGGYRPDAPFIPVVAARYAREHAESGQRPWRLCRGTGDTAVGCVSAFETTVWFSDCDATGCADECLGHELFCERHLAELLAGELHRINGPTPAVSRYEANVSAVPF